MTIARVQAMLHDLQYSPATAHVAEDEHVWIKEAAEVQIVCVANNILPPMRWLMRV